MAYYRRAQQPALEEKSRNSHKRIAKFVQFVADLQLIFATNFTNF